MSELLALGLWFSCYSRAIAGTQPSQRLVANYRMFSDAPDEVLRRINDWLGLFLSNEAIEQACSTVKTDMVHHQLDEVTANDLLKKRAIPTGQEVVLSISGRGAILAHSMTNGLLACYVETRTVGSGNTAWLSVMLRRRSSAI